MFKIHLCVDLCLMPIETCTLVLETLVCFIDRFYSHLSCFFHLIVSVREMKQCFTSEPWGKTVVFLLGKLGNYHFISVSFAILRLKHSP